MEIKVIFFDLDDTLLDSQKKISEYSRRILEKCREMGIKIGFVTSRTLRKLSDLLEGVSYDFLAAYNGAWITIEGEVYQQNAILHNDGIRIIYELEKVFSQIEVCAYFEPYIYWEGEIQDRVTNKIIRTQLNEYQIPFQRIRVRNADLQKFPQNSKWLPDYVKVYEQGKDIFLEHEGCCKGKVVKQVLNIYGISSENAIAFGNSSVDIPMLKACGRSVAVANAEAEVLQLTKDKTGSNDKDGVAAFLERELFQKKTLEEHHLVKTTLKKEDGVILLEDAKEQAPMIRLEEKKFYDAKIPHYFSYVIQEVVTEQETEKMFLTVLEKSKFEVAKYIGRLAETIYEKKGKNLVVVSLIRGGISIGALITRYLRMVHGVTIPHYGIAMIKDIGLDLCALNIIYNLHPNPKVQFVDGWTGTGGVAKALKKWVKEYNCRYGRNLDDSLATVSDTGRISSIYGTRKDILLPNSCLNAVLSGLISSVYYDDSKYYETEFFGGIYLEYLEKCDMTNRLLDEISACFSPVSSNEAKIDKPGYVADMIQQMATDLGVTDARKIRPGYGETLRALLRSKVEKLVLADPQNQQNRVLLAIAGEKKIIIVKYDKNEYCCAAILQ